MGHFPVKNENLSIYLSIYLSIIRRAREGHADSGRETIIQFVVALGSLCIYRVVRTRNIIAMYCICLLVYLMPAMISIFLSIMTYRPVTCEIYNVCLAM